MPCTQYSCGNKTIEINDLIIEKNADLMFISESWINKRKDAVKIKEMVPAGYKIKLEPRSSRSGGGVAIIHRISLKITPAPVPSFSTFELLSLIVKTPNASIYCSCIYRPTPGKKNNSNFSQFLLDFNSFLETLTTYDHIYIFGDFNIHFENQHNPSAQKFKKLLQEHSFNQLVKVPTHICGHTLDLIITRDSEVQLYNPSVLDLCLSDHYILSLSLPYYKQKQT